VSDLSPLATKTGMLSLNLTGTPVSDITALALMKRLENLDMRATPVKDLSPLAGMTKLHHLDLFDTPVTDLSPLAETGRLSLELGGSAVKALSPLRGMHNARITLYKYPDEQVPTALEPRLQQVRISPIYKRYGE
jgi:internalin A